MADPLNEALEGCESARQDFDDPLERLREVIDNEDQYEVESVTAECIEALMVLEDSLDELTSACAKRRLSIRSNAGLVRREFASLRKELKSIGTSGSEGDELQDRMDDWGDSFDDLDAALSDLIEAARSEVTGS